jgi:hypothetical protein
MRNVNQAIDAKAYRFVLLASLLLAACGSSKKEQMDVAKLAEPCSINSNCDSPLVCVFSHCHEQCEADRDCAAKERCIKGVNGHVCQLTAETKCTRDHDCSGDQLCGVDGQCRDACKTVDDCSGGQICAKSGECASTDPGKDTVDSDGNIVVVDSGSAGMGGAAGKSGTGGTAGKSGAGGSAGKSGAGGAAGGGSGGSGGAAGGAGMSGDPCGAETQPNEDRDHASALDLNTDIKFCLQNKTDVDFYEFKAPAEPAQGGYFVVKVTQVGTTGGVDVIAQSAADNGNIQESDGSSGVSVFFWFNAKAGATFRLSVDVYTGGASAIPYTLRVDYKGVPDDNEPNDLRAQATPMTFGTPIHGYLFAGFENSTSVADAAWEDWFKVTLDGTPVQIALTDIASDIGASVDLYDTNGVPKDSKSETQGASVVWSPSSDLTATPGDYYLKVNQYTGGYTKATGATVPAYLSQPYTLNVTAKP